MSVFSYGGTLKCLDCDFMWITTKVTNTSSDECPRCSLRKAREVIVDLQGEITDLRKALELVDKGSI